MSESESHKNKNAIVKEHLDGKVVLSIYPKNLTAEGKSIGHITVVINDPQKRSIEGKYPLSVACKRATIVTKPNNHSLEQPSNRKNTHWLPFITENNKLALNFLPDKNTDESEVLISTPWGEIKETLKFSGSLKNSMSEMLESVIYALIIAIIIRTFLLQAFFIPSQSMEKTLEIGDRIVVNKLLYTFRDPVRQEVIVFKTFTPKDRMMRFHLDDSMHFDPSRSLRDPNHYKNAYEVVRSIMDRDYLMRNPNALVIKDGGMYVSNLCIGFPRNEEPGKLYLDDTFFADGTISIDSGTFELPNQFLGNLYIQGNHLFLGDNLIDLGRIDVYYPLGHPGIVHHYKLAPKNPLVDGIKSAFFKIIGRRPQLIVGENQIIGDLIFKNGSWTIFNQAIDIDLEQRPIRFSLPFQGADRSRLNLGMMYSENGHVILKQDDRVIRNFGEVQLRNDVAVINDQIFGYIGRNESGLTVNGQPIHTLWETRDFIKRCIAVPGDNILIQNGKVFINGEELNEPYISSENRDLGNYGPETIEKNYYFVVGDNRNNSKDSRRTGPILRDNIVGRAEYIFWPLDRFTRILAPQ